MVYQNELRKTRTIIYKQQLKIASMYSKTNIPENLNAEKKGLLNRLFSYNPDFTFTNENIGLKRSV